MTNVQQRYFLLPDDAIHAESGREFRVLLRRVLVESGLTPGQIVNTSGIARAQVWSLGSERRPRLPRKRSQVQRYLVSCRLDPQQVASIMKLFDRLRRKRA